MEEGENQNYQDDSFIGKSCAVCNVVPDSIIYLSCDHIICLICAAKAIL